MKKAIMIGLGLLAGATVALAAVTSEQNIKVDSVVIGRPSPAADPEIKFKGATTKIKANRTTSKLQFTNDGTTYKNLGSGSGGAGGTNLLADDNFDFEVGTPFTGWTASGGTVTAETTNPLFDDKSLKWDSSASAQTLTSATKTIKAGFVGRSCQAEIYYKWPSGVAGDLTLEARDGTPATVATINLNPTVGDAVTRAQLQFDCPALAGTLTLRLLSNVSNPAEITIDNAFIGSGNSTFNLSQAEIYGAVNYNNAANCEVSTTSGTVAEVADDADCTARAVVGNASFVNNQFKMRFANGLPAGRYELTTMVPAYVTGSGTACEFYVTSSGGTGMPSQYAVLDVAGNGQSNPRAQSVNVGWNIAAPVSGPVDFFMNWRRTAGAGTCFMGTVNAGGATFSMSLKKFPTVSSEAITLETSGWFFDGNIGGGNGNLGTASVTTYTSISNASLDLVLNSGSATGRIACDGGNPSTGLTCAAGNEQFGVSVDLPQAGLYEACFDFTHNLNPNAGPATVNTVFQVARTTDTSATIIQEGNTRIGQTISSVAANGMTLETPHHNCGLFNIPSAGRHAFRLFYEQAVSGTIAQSSLLADRGASNGQRDIHVTIRPWNQQMPAPVFTAMQGNVKSNISNEKIERARINNNGSTCPILSQSGTWISGTSRSGTGVCVLTMAGFAGAPSCTVMTAGGAADVANQGAVTPTTTSLTVSTFTSSTGAASDKAFDVICMGPK